MTITRRAVLGTTLAASGLLSGTVRAAVSGIEKPKLTIAVGGKNLFYYLPLTIAEQRGFFRDEGLAVEIADLAGGSAALRAVVGGSADVVSGAFEHTINLQSKGQDFTAFVLQGRAPQIVLAVSKKNMPEYKSVADLKGRKIGVTAPGSSTNMVANFVLAKAGLKPSDVAFIGVGASAGAVSAMRSGQIDAIANLDPVIAMLERDGLVRVVSDTRTLKDTETVFGGPMPAACLYAPSEFVRRNPNTTQALTNAMVRALKWLQTAGPSDIVKTVPEAFLLGDRALYLDAWMKVREAISPDGLIPEVGVRTALKALQAFDKSLEGKPIALERVYTNDFTRKALASVR